MTLLQLPSFLIGPSQGARSSTILERSGDGEAIPDAERRLLNDLPLAIAGWMRRRAEDEIYGCLPLTRTHLGGRLLFRAVYLRDLGGEPMGLASGLYLGREVLQALGGHSERLAHLLPLPERGTAFTAAPLALDPAALPQPPAPVGIGLEWDDRAVQLGDDTPPLEVAQQLLAGLGHPPQDHRVLGWITTARFPRLGGIDPRASFQLVVCRGNLPEDPYLSGTWHAGQYHGEVIAPPPAWAAWQNLYARLGDDPQLAEACSWSGNLAEVPPGQVPEALLQRLLGWPRDGPQLYLRLLIRLAEDGTLGNPAALLDQRLLALDRPAQARLFSALLAQPPAVLGALDAERLLRARPDLVGELDPPALGAVLGIMDYFNWPELTEAHLAALPAQARFAALDHGLDRIEADPITARRLVLPVKLLVAALIRETDSTVQADSRTAVLVKRIGQIQNRGLAEIVTQSLWGTYSYWLKRLPGDAGTPVRRQMLRIDPALPASLAELGRLGWLIGEANRAGVSGARGAMQ